MDSIPEEKGINKAMLIVVSAVIGALVLWGIISPEGLDTAMNATLAWVTANLGWFFLIVVFLFVVAMLIVMISKWGKIRLGGEDAKPEFTTIRWFAMLFAAAMGIGLVFWGVSEPLSHYFTPPFGDPASDEAVGIALRYSYLHWGMSAWVVYAFVGMCLGYFAYNLGRPFTVGSVIEPLVGNQRWLMPVADFTAIFATFLGVATSLGLGVMQVAEGLNAVFGFPANNTVYSILVLVFTACFITSAVTGIKRGIAVLSNTNLWLAGFLLVAVFVLGNPRFVLNVLTTGIGEMLQNFVGMSTWTNALNDGAWVGGWTVFYWAWWIAWAPFVGGFIARISKGRTIREFVAGVLVIPSLICATWMAVWGGNAIFMQHNGIFDFKPMLDASTASPIFGMLQQMPGTTFLSVLLILVISIFFITSADSATFVAGMYCSYGNENPKTWLRVVLGLLEGGLALVLLITGGLTALQTASIVGALPFLGFMIAMWFSISKALNKQVAKMEQEKIEMDIQQSLSSATTDETLTT
ncbi:MAG: BCCT family transporter [Syntrophaceticus sp.]|nr:BCCT family transporter [Syntrophaceticus sp.]MDD4782085.1 BCCT family transporter [Syntrophaceticus sp.]